VAGRRGASFRPAAGPVRAGRPSRQQAAVLVVALLAVAGAIVTASFTVKPSKARSFDLYYGSVYLNDNTAPVAVDLASGKPSVRLQGAYTQVSASESGDLDVVPLASGTLMLDNVTGEFNMVDNSGYVLKAEGGGVPLPATTDVTTATGIAAGDSAYIVRTGPSGTSVYLVSQSTVGAAVGGGKTQPRASAQMNDPATSVRTTAGSANGGLWLLVGSGDSRTIRELSVPAGSNAGVTLTTRDHGTVNGVAALGVATAQADGTGGDAVAVATKDSVQVFSPDGTSHTLTVREPATVDQILPVTNQRGSFAFLYHGTAGWSLVRAGSSAGGSAGVTQLPALGTAAQLAVPAQSNGLLYTLDLGNGALWQLPRQGEPTRVPAVNTYPILTGETSDFTTATVYGSGSRVIFNSRSKLEAVTVFTDGSHKPFVIDKRTAFSLSPNGAAALSNLHRPPPGPTTAPPTSKPQQNQQVTDKIDCKTTTQIPHIPTLELLDRGARSVQIRWNYPLLDRQDCEPSTYTVSVQTVGNEKAPEPPATQTIQGTDSVNLTGLFPDTDYRIVVNAYINGKHTPSQPLLVRTSIEGPAAPTGVHAAPDALGNWTITWDSCGGIQNGCVPAVNWTVVPQLCDSGAGLVSAPANAHLIGDPSQHSFSMVYKGRDDLLGRGLSFQVAGVGDKGTTGTTSKSSSCAYSWRAPDPAKIQVAASTPPQTSVSGTTSTKVSLSFTGDENVAIGGVGGQFTYQLLSGGSVVTTKGPTTDTSVLLDGILPGQSYQVRVVVSPPRHPTASVSLNPVDVQAAVANWPAISASASFAKTSANRGTLTVSINGLASSDARGETFDLVNSRLVCGNSSLDLDASNFDPAHPGSKLTFDGIDRSQYYDDCKVGVQLSENASTRRSPAYFGGNPSGSDASPSFTIPVPDLNTTADQFKANFVDTGILGQPRVAISYQGNNDLIGQFSGSWALQVQRSDDSGATWTNCGDSSNGNAAAAPVTIVLPYSCYSRSASWQVTVDFTYFRQSPSPAYLVPVDKTTAPAPVDPASMSFSASWNGNSVDLAYSGPYSQATLNQLNWTIQVHSSGSPGQVCNDGEQPDHDSPPRQNGTLPLPVDLTTCPAQTGGSTNPPSPPTTSTYTITIHFKDPNYGTTGDYTVDNIDGTPPS
jgi:hypothetical protein